MENEYKLTTFGGAELPITVCERYAVLYETSERELSEEEAKLDAERKMSEYIGSLEEGTVVLGISRSDSFKMGEYRINCRLYLIENIAREVRGEIPPKTEHNE